ncbi:hypothetical protein KDH_51510 [Dictyobacter sp. S3.2.2.5]|uniref:Uncharacterized protein n=2 Tax=Dictyobacter halimunensis TaxID=3026934 RepID=A0ABQ6FZA2_9CHLR|nr:hypothetical protein KDH_51510 [Dictyobacter sp. S3.2.2.5]
MVRQCAWCLRLINSAGERLSPLPLPKLYEASHGICGICGMQWMEQVIEADGPLGSLQRQEVDVTGGYPDVARHEPIVQLVLQLQEPAPELDGGPRPGRRSVEA